MRRPRRPWTSLWISRGETGDIRRRLARLAWGRRTACDRRHCGTRAEHYRRSGATGRSPSLRVRIRPRGVVGVGSLCDAGNSDPAGVNRP
ncbi:hypothetical protein SMD_2782 [Stenotrophomonas maltophilia D457]|nr:hypothetical protein SMD_2782 [Stenotrophomonas maltophilia D457]